MKTFVINPETKEIIEKDLNTLNDYYNEIGNGCSLIEAVTHYENYDCLFCDEEGIFHEHEHGFIFGVGSEENPMEEYFFIVGKGILVGGTEDGENDHVKIKPEELEKRVVFVSSEDVIKYKSMYA